MYNNNNNNNNLLLSIALIDFNLPYVITIMTHLPAFSIGSQTKKKKSFILMKRRGTSLSVIRCKWRVMVQY